MDVNASIKPSPFMIHISISPGRSSHCCSFHSTSSCYTRSSSLCSLTSGTTNSSKFEGLIRTISPTIFAAYRPPHPLPIQTATNRSNNYTMAYNERRYQTLCRLGVEQLPSLCSERSYDDMGPSLKKCKRDYNDIVAPIGGDLPVRSMPVSR